MIYRSVRPGCTDSEGTRHARGALEEQPSTWSRLRAALAPDEWLRLGSMSAVIVALHLIGWITLVLVVEPAHLSLGDKAFGLGVGLTAYTLGCGTRSTPITSPRSTTRRAS
ncbi:putative high-affinity nickel-transporter [Mycobacterium xenopi 3993]|nr:putative high-affinity nickel-transporter [Mycobacterium xenopi 3993]